MLPPQCPLTSQTASVVNYSHHGHDGSKQRPVKHLRSVSRQEVGAQSGLWGLLIAALSGREEGRPLTRVGHSRRFEAAGLVRLPQKSCFAESSARSSRVPDHPPSSQMYSRSRVAPLILRMPAIARVLLRASLAEEFHLLDDDVLRRSEACLEVGSGMDPLDASEPAAIEDRVGRSMSLVKRRRSRLVRRWRGFPAAPIPGSS